MYIKNWYDWQITSTRKVKTHYFNIVDYTDADFTSKIETVQSDPEYVAEEIAERYFSEDPCDPAEFKCKIQIKHNEMFLEFDCYAEVETSFYARKISNGDSLINKTTARIL